MVAVVCLVVVFSSGFASAADFDNTKNYDKATETITIENLFGLGRTIATHTLTDNTYQCLIDCYAEGTSTLNEPQVLFQGVEFKNRLGDTKEINDFKYFLQVEDATDGVRDTYLTEEVCTQTIIPANLTNGTEEVITEDCVVDFVLDCVEIPAPLNDTNGTATTSCEKIVNGTEEFETITYDWKRYFGDELPAGEYKWRLEGRKENLGNIDWIVSSNGLKLSEWAWWNSTWEFKKEITITENSGSALNNYSVLLNVSKESSMNNDFSDLRFLDSSESSELGYFIESYSDGQGYSYDSFSLGTEVLIVAGGGEGDACYAGGGGGAGGLLYNNTMEFSSGNYSVTIGSGGSGITDSCAGTGPGNSGGNSIFNGQTAIGGGGGGKYTNGNGLSGGSGGGGADSGGSGGSGTAGQGYAGGTGGATSGGAGGGGAGEVGYNGSGGGDYSYGGDGLRYSISGTATYYAGGGAGGRVSGDAYGGLGGGGWYLRSNSSYTSGVDGLGGGGAAGGNDGGDGVVVIAYNTDGSSGLSNDSMGGTKTYSGGRTIHTFTSGGTFTAVATEDTTQNDLLSDLVSYYKFDGDVLDAVGTNNGTDTGTANTTGILGTGARTIGTGDEIDLGSALLGTSANDPFTLTAWTKITDTADSQRAILSQYTTGGGTGRMTWDFQSDEKIRLFINGNSVLSDNSVEVGVWNFMSVTRDSSGNVKHYINGVLAGTGTLSDAIQNDNTKWGEVNTANELKGDLDEAGIWSRALSATEVLNLYNAQYGDVWVKAPTLTASANTSVYMYYGNSGATSNSNGDDAFILYAPSNDTSYVQSTSGVMQIIFNKSVYINGAYKHRVAGVKNTKTGTSWSAYIGLNINHYGTLGFINDASEKFNWGSDDCDADGTNFDRTTSCRFGNPDGAINKTVTDKIRLSPNLTAGEYDAVLYHYLDTASQTSTLNWFHVITSAYATSEPTYTIGAETTSSTLAITQNTPEDVANLTTITPTFNCSGTSNTGLYSLNLTINGSVYESVTGNGTTNLSLQSVETLSDGYWEWYCVGDDIDGALNSTTRSLTIDATNPALVAEITTPIIYNYGDNVTFNYTITDTNLDSCIHTYPDNNVGTSAFDYITPKMFYGVTTGLVYNNANNDNVFRISTFGSDWSMSYTSGYGVDKMNISDFYEYPQYCPTATYISGAQVITSADEGYYACVQTENDGYYYLTYDTFSSTIQDNVFSSFNNTAGLYTSFNCSETNQSFATLEDFSSFVVYANDTFGNSNSTALSFAYDTIAPTISITSPVSSIPSHVIGDNLTLNTTITDTNLDTCWYEYNGANVTIDGCQSGVLNSTSFLYVYGVDTITAYANDSLGNTNSSSTSWIIDLVEYNQTYPNSSTESDTKEYTATFKYNSTKHTIATAVLSLDGTTYAGTRSGSGDLATFTTTATIPSVTTETNYTAYWTASLTDVVDTTEYNLTSHNVTSIPIAFALCNGAPDVPYWNFTIKNETNFAAVNANFEATFDVRLGSSTTSNYFNYSYTAGAKSEFDFCMSPATENYTIDTAIQLSATGFVTKFYNFEDFDVSNTTTETDLFMMSLADSTSFIVHVVYTTAIDVDDAEVQVQRYYAGSNQWVTTEILTTNDVGTAVGHILAEDADYRFKVYKDGVSIHNSSATKITCAVTPCTITLVLSETSGTGFEVIEDLTSTLVFSNNVFTYTYTDTSGTFSNARLYVKQLSPANATINAPCDTSKTSSTGIITCDIFGELNGTYVATGYVTRDSAEFLDKRVYSNLGTKIYDAMGSDGVLWSIFVLIGIVMLGVTRPSLAIVFGIVGFIALALIGMINIGAISIVSVVAIGIILLVRVGRE